MADIFISYSSKDREKAEQLTELLISAGLSVWIDRSSLEVSTSWSAEIVDAISSCTAFIVLLSPNSVESHNVIKEVSLASEKRKKILPLDLEPIAIPRELEYQLAGIHRTSMTNIDAIIRAISKLGLEATQAPTMKLVKETAGRKSLMILPFEDLSPTADNQWFTDGMASELINTLSNVKALKLIDWNTSKLLKNKAIRTVELAKDFSVRYFVEGQVRKFGDNIKISITLLDIETGDHLWQDNLKGTMADVFDIQEEAAKKVLAGLDVILTNKEEELVTKKPTENAEAYELYMKGNEYYLRFTKSDFDLALGLYVEAARLDPNFPAAHASIASTCAEIYQTYDRSTERLLLAKRAAERAREIEGVTAQYSWVMSRITLVSGDAVGALRFAQKAVETDPNYAPGYDALAFALKALGRNDESLEAREKNVNLREMDTTAHFNLLISLNELSSQLPSSPEGQERLREAADRAVPIFERHVRFAPDDYHARVQLTNVLWMAGRGDDALRAAEAIEAAETLDGVALYNLACLYLHLYDAERGLRALRRAVEKGFRNLETFRRDPDLAPLRGTPEFEALIKELETTNG